MATAASHDSSWNLLHVSVLSNAQGHRNFHQEPLKFSGWRLPRAP